MRIDLGPVWRILGGRPVGAEPFPDDLIPLSWMGWTGEGASRALNGLQRLGVFVLGDLKLVCKQCLLAERYMGERTVSLLEGAAIGLGYPLAQVNEGCAFCSRREFNERAQAAKALR